ncbi:hypothetical protein KKA94_02910 [Patescibacteria group bacterium]|nr:hypothetical protein [Patescibacteria group bacterium]
MEYNYQEIIKDRMEKDPEFAQKVKNLREKRKMIENKDHALNLLGNVDDINIGRPTLRGNELVINFRILRLIGLKWNLASLLGEKAGDGIVYSIGVKLGRSLVSGNVIKGKDSKEFITNFAALIMNMKIGVSSIVEWKKDFPNIVKVDECVSCGGMSNIGEMLCHYEGGIIAGTFSEYFKGLIVANEVLCWGHGDETCQFELHAK